MLCQLLAATNRQKFRHVVVSLATPGILGAEIAALGIPISSPGCASAMDLLKLPRLMRLIRHERPALLHGWMYHANLAGLWAAHHLGIPCIWALHNCNLDAQAIRLRTRLLVQCSAWLSHRPTAIVSCSHTALATHLAIGYRPRQSFVIPNGFDTERFRPDATLGQEFRHELGIPAATILIGLIARFDPQKDHRNFLAAAACLVRRLSDCSTSPPVRFVLCGKDVVPGNEQLTAWVTELGLAAHVHLLGMRHDIPRLLAALDIATSSSWGEAFPMVVGEAMSCGVPGVVTDVGDSALLVGATGVIVPPRQPEALAQGWLSLIQAGKNGRQALGQAARDRIVSHYGIAAIAQQYERLYQTLW